MAPVRFDIEELLGEARKATGLHDFGLPDLRAGLAARAATAEGRTLRPA